MKNLRTFSLVALCVATVAISLTAIRHARADHVAGHAPDKTTITFLGQAAFKIETPLGRVLLIDPWLRNPLNPDVQAKKDPVAGLKRVDYQLITHGHSDHVGDAVEIAKKTGARLVATFELGMNLARAVGYPEKLMGFDTLINAGGEIEIAEGEVRVAMVPAIHSSGLDVPAPKGKKPGPMIYGGSPVGLVIKIKNGPTIYHTGDTAYFKDMELIGEQHHPDVALINIGGHFGMEPAQAAQAALAVGAKIVVPHHYKTFPILAQDTASFKQGLGGKLELHELAPGQSLVFHGAALETH